MAAKLTAAKGGRSSPSERPATPKTRSARVAEAIISPTWTASRLAEGDARKVTASAARTIPAAIRASSSRRTPAGAWAWARRYATAAMMARAATPLIAVKLHERMRRGIPTAAQADPKSGSTPRAPDALCWLANSTNHNVRARDWVRTRRRGGAPGGRYLLVLA